MHICSSCPKICHKNDAVLSVLVFVDSLYLYVKEGANWLAVNLVYVDAALCGLRFLSTLMDILI